MNCPKHPSVKMIALFTSYVCDICDPPKGASKEEPLVAPLYVGFAGLWCPNDEELDEFFGAFTD